MRMTIEEKKVLYAFGCPDHFNTVTRLRQLAMLAVDPGTKKLAGILALKLLDKGVDKWNSCFYYNLRIEMEGYFNALKTIHRAEVRTIDPEDYGYDAHNGQEP